MKTLAIVGSPRKNGNTEMLAGHTLKAIEEEVIDGHTLKAIEEEVIDTELVSLAELDIKPCNACEACNKEERCPINDDLWPLYTKMKEADAIILASPVYFGSATPEIKALMDRSGYIAYNNGMVFAGKVGGPLVVGERSGQNFTIAQLAYWFFINGCFVPGSTGWNGAFGFDRGEVTNDTRGLKTAWNFGKNIALLIKKLKA
jgi:multimeric flavodoxin WrbA